MRPVDQTTEQEVLKLANDTSSGGCFDNVKITGATEGMVLNEREGWILAEMERDNGAKVSAWASLSFITAN